MDIKRSVEKQFAAVAANYASHPVMASGLTRVVELARRIRAGEAGRGLAHAASGAALQQNLLCILEGDA